MSLSLELDQCLEIMGPSTERTHQKDGSSSMKLLQEKQKLKRQIFASDFVPLSTKQDTSDALLEQITSSIIDPPKYWAKQNISQGMAIKSKTSNSGRPKSKAYKAAKNKGEDYNSRLNMKLQNQGTKSRLKQSILHKK
jgi:hypothetical protein